MICKDMKNIFVIQGDSLQRRYTFYDKDKNMITNQYLNSVLFSCKRLNYEQFLVYDDGAWVLTLTSEITSNFNQCRTSYDITLYFESEQVSTQVYRAEFNVLKKDMIQDVEVSGEGESVNLDDIDVVVDTNVNIIVSGSKNHDELEHRDYENQHPMSAITGLEDTLQKLNNDKQNKINEYLKSASVSGNTLNLTKQDDSVVSFTPQGGGGGDTWHFIRSVTASTEHIDQNVSYVTDENGNVCGFTFDKDADGNVFSYKDIAAIGILKGSENLSLAFLVGEIKANITLVSFRSDISNTFRAFQWKTETIGAKRSFSGEYCTQYAANAVKLSPNYLANSSGFENPQNFMNNVPDARQVNKISAYTGVTTRYVEGIIYFYGKN